ncbi:hypothetical protein DIPPA_10495 [Diplonema papillatum]|nr:hypothetical protein DIPPA_10495 [Diplonema papillatum]
MLLGFVILAVLAVAGWLYLKTTMHRSTAFPGLPHELFVRCRWIPELAKCDGQYTRTLRTKNEAPVWEKSGSYPRWLCLADNGFWHITADKELGGAPLVASKPDWKRPHEGVWHHAASGDEVLLSEISNTDGFHVGDSVEANTTLSDSVVAGTRGRVCGATKNLQHLLVSFNRGEILPAPPGAVDRLDGPKISILCDDLVWRRGRVVSYRSRHMKIRYDGHRTKHMWVLTNSARCVAMSVCPSVGDYVVLSPFGLAALKKSGDRCLGRGDVGRVVSDAGPFEKHGYLVRALGSGNRANYSREELLPKETDTGGLLKAALAKENTGDAMFGPQCIARVVEARCKTSQKRLEVSFVVISESDSDTSSNASFDIKRPSVNCTDSFTATTDRTSTFDCYKTRSGPLGSVAPTDAFDVSVVSSLEDSSDNDAPNDLTQTQVRLESVIRQKRPSSVSAGAQEKKKAAARRSERSAAAALKRMAMRPAPLLNLYHLAGSPVSPRCGAADDPARRDSAGGSHHRREPEESPARTFTPRQRSNTHRSSPMARSPPLSFQPPAGHVRHVQSAAAYFPAGLKAQSPPRCQAISPRAPCFSAPAALDSVERPSLISPLSSSVQSHAAGAPSDDALSRGVNENSLERYSDYEAEATVKVGCAPPTARKLVPEEAAEEEEEDEEEEESDSGYLEEERRRTIPCRMSETDYWSRSGADPKEVSSPSELESYRFPRMVTEPVVADPPESEPAIPALPPTAELLRMPCEPFVQPSPRTPRAHLTILQPPAPRTQDAACSPITSPLIRRPEYSCLPPTVHRADPPPVPASQCRGTSPTHPVGGLEGRGRPVGDQPEPGRRALLESDPASPVDIRRACTGPVDGRTADVEHLDGSDRSIMSSQGLTATPGVTELNVSLSAMSPATPLRLRDLAGTPRKPVGSKAVTDVYKSPRQPVRAVTPVRTTSPVRTRSPGRQKSHRGDPPPKRDQLAATMPARKTAKHHHHQLSTVLSALPAPPRPGAAFAGARPGAVGRKKAAGGAAKKRRKSREAGGASDTSAPSSSRLHGSVSSRALTQTFPSPNPSFTASLGSLPDELPTYTRSYSTTPPALALSKVMSSPHVNSDASKSTRRTSPTRSPTRRQQPRQTSRSNWAAPVKQASGQAGVKIQRRVSGPLKATITPPTAGISGPEASARADEVVVDPLGVNALVWDKDNYLVDAGHKALGAFMQRKLIRINATPVGSSAERAKLLGNLRARAPSDHESNSDSERPLPDSASGSTMSSVTLRFSRRIESARPYQNS